MDAYLDAALIPVGQALLSGVLVGGVYGLMSIGFSLAFGVMRIVNFAHGDLVMYGMYVGVVASTAFGVDPLYSIPISFLLMALLGAAQYQLVFKRFVGAATLQQLLAAIGLGLVSWIGMETTNPDASLPPQLLGLIMSLLGMVVGWLMAAMGQVREIEGVAERVLSGGDVGNRAQPTSLSGEGGKQ